MDPRYLLVTFIMDDRLRDAENRRLAATVRASRPRRRLRNRKAGEAT
jgi:hypothetical protein